MDQPAKRTAFTLRDARTPLKWSILLLVSIAFIVPLELVHLPAALLLGAMAAAILVAVFDGRLAVPQWPYVLAQGLIGCLVARSIGATILVTMVRQWPLFLAGVCSVLLISTTLGALLARWKVLPGTTAIWGSSPGAATVMVLMSEGFGGDPRLVAYMQFLRVIVVALVASIVARLWVAPGALPRAAIDWFPAVAAGPFWETVALAVFGSIAGAKSRLPAALADGRVLRPDRLVHRAAILARDCDLRRARFPEDRRIDLDVGRAVRRLGSAAARRRRHRPLNCVPCHQSRRRRFGRDHRCLLPCRRAIRDGHADGAVHSRVTRGSRIGASSGTVDEELTGIAGPAGARFRFPVSISAAWPTNA